MKKLSISLLLLLLSICGYAQLSENYYKPIDGKKEAALKAALHDVIAPHTKISYNGLWGAYENVDYLDNTNSSGQHQVFDYYSDQVFYFPGNGSAVSGMNREHVVPQSWWGGGTGVAVGSDLLQVLPSESKANSAKGNFPLGIVVGNASYANSRMKTGHDKNGKMVFEPCDEYKGDFARIYFYVATCYPDTKWENRSDVNVAFKKEAYPTIKSDIIDMLLEWSVKDTVSTWEIIRMERAYKQQGNRNPFVDYPDLANYIWGDKKTEAFDLATAVLHHVDVVNPDPDPDPNIEHGDTLLIETFAECESGNNYNTSGSQTLWSGNDNIVSVTAVYEAGGAIKMGTGSKAGSIQTRTIDFEGGTLIVEADVKGWSSVEGLLEISIPDCGSQQASYTATMNDAFEKVSLTFEDVPANPSVIYTTTSKRCFIDEIRVIKAKTQEDPDGIATIADDSFALSRTSASGIYSITGQRIDTIDRSGLYIINGRKVFVKK